MAAFEGIRAAAAQLREELGASVDDMSRSLAVIDAGVQHLDLLLTWARPDDPQLRGARAAFDAQCGMIYCADDGEAFDRAMRVAHEIGHVRVHSRSTICEPGDIDGS